MVNRFNRKSWRDISGNQGLNLFGRGSNRRIGMPVLY
jgi:hypothetical protein